MAPKITAIQTADKPDQNDEHGCAGDVQQVVTFHENATKRQPRTPDLRAAKGVQPSSFRQSSAITQKTGLSLFIEQLVKNDVIF